jgi:hypothetical protein
MLYYLEKVCTFRRARSLGGCSCCGASIAGSGELLRITFLSGIDEVIKIKVCRRKVKKLISTIRS